MRIALIVDNPYRDLPGLVLVAVRLCQQGATCYLVPMNLQWRELAALAPDFVLLNYLRTVNQDLAWQLMNAGIKVGVLDTEGGVLASLDTYAKLMAREQSLRYRVSCFCSWGIKFAEYVIEKGWYRRDQVVVTGSPRFDFYVHPWREAALKLSPYVEVYSRPIVLINANFPLANPCFQTPQEEVQGMVKRFGYDRDYILKWQTIQREAMLGMVTLANSLAACFPYVTFIYRPHPFERLETYRELLEPRENLHLVRMGTVDGWILRASAVIQRSCSTAIEAGMAGVSTLSPTWIPTPVRMEAAEAVSIPCKSQKELEEKLEGILNGQAELPKAVSHVLDRVIEDWFYKVDGKSNERVANAILAHLDKKSTSRVRLRKCRDLLYGLGKPGISFKARAIITLRKTLGLPVDWSFRRWREIPPKWRWDRSEKYYDAEQVRRVVDAVIECYKQEGDISFTKIGVLPSQEHGDYHFGYAFGRSVTVYPM